MIHRRRRVSCKRADLSKRGKKEYTQAFNNHHHHHLAPSTSSSTSISWSDSLDHETEIHRREKDIDGPHTHTRAVQTEDTRRPASDITTAVVEVIKQARRSKRSPFKKASFRSIFHLHPALSSRFERPHSSTHLPRASLWVSTWTRLDTQGHGYILHDPHSAALTGKERDRALQIGHEHQIDHRV